MLLTLSACSESRDKNAFLPEAENDKIFTVLDDGAPSCFVEIVCTEALESDILADAKRAILPNDGMIIPKTEVNFTEGESVLDVVSRAVRERKIHLDFSETPALGSSYIKGISNLYEKDCGENSGWMYFVNDESPSVSYSEYIIQDGDEISFRYICDWTTLYQD